MFNRYLAKLNDLAQNITHENFMELQKIEVEILNSEYDFDNSKQMTYMEKRAILVVLRVLKTKMREQFIGLRGV